MQCALVIRERVFVEEQGIPLFEDRDGNDERSVHVLACVGELPVGTGRLLPRPDGLGHLARIAVLPDFRGRGLGGRIVRTLESCARKAGLRGVYLEAHEHLAPFYRRLGYHRTPGTRRVGTHRLVNMTKTFE